MQSPPFAQRCELHARAGLGGDPEQPGNALETGELQGRLPDVDANNLQRRPRPAPPYRPCSVAIRAATVAILLPVGSGPAMASELVGRASIIDGDTIEIQGRRVRLFASRAPPRRLWW